MKIKSLTLGGFKGIKNTATIPLAPITLLFGANSTGKSTILHGLLYLYEILVNENLDPEYSQLTGNKVWLGGFDSLIYNKDCDNTLTIGLSLDLADKSTLVESFISEVEEELLQKEMLWVPECYMKNWECKFEIAWSSFDLKPYVRTFESYSDGQLVCRICRKSGGRQTIITDLNFRYEWLDSVPMDFFPIVDLVRHPAGIAVAYSGAIPDLSRRLCFPQKFDWKAIWRGDEAIAQMAYETAFAQAVLSPAKELVAHIKQLVHIGPLRVIPDYNFSILGEYRPDSWYDGSGAWDEIANFENMYTEGTGGDLCERINKCFMTPEFFNTPYSIQSIDESYEHEFVPHRDGVFIRDERLGINQPFTEVGVGISQVIPVVVGICHDRMKIVSCEQPELHIHPKWQLALADMMLKYNDESIGKMFLMETHSEHLLLRLMRRRRETVEETLDDPSLACGPDDVQIIFCEKTEEGTCLTPIAITDEGEFDAPWPNGFFEERRKEFF